MEETDKLLYFCLFKSFWTIMDKRQLTEADIILECLLPVTDRNLCPLNADIGILREYGVKLLGQEMVRITK